MASSNVIEVDRETGQVLGERALAKIEHLEETAIIAALKGRVTPTWVYRFQQGGKWIENLSIVGVEQAAREMAVRGEVLRELEVTLEYEDEREARFLARAGRFAVSGDGSEFPLDIAIRGKRQSKYLQLREGGEKFNERWYEVGIAKAVRNAKAALINDTVRRYIVDQARTLTSGVVTVIEQPDVRPPVPTGQPPPPDPVQPDEIEVEIKSDGMAWNAFWGSANRRSIPKMTVHRFFGLGADSGLLADYARQRAINTNLSLRETVLHMRDELLSGSQPTSNLTG